MNESTPTNSEIDYSPISHEIMDLGHLSETETALLKVMIEKAERGLEHLSDDPTVRAAVNALFLEEQGYSTDDLSVDSGSKHREKVPQSKKVDTEIDTNSLEASKAKLLEAVSEEKFNLAVLAAKELDPKLKLPKDAYTQIMAEINKLSPERVQEICGEMEKPTLIIVPANSFDKKVKQMDKNKHYKEQDNTFVARGKDEPYSQVAKVDNVRVCIVDGVVHPKQQKDAPIDLGLVARRKYEQVRFADKNMKLAGPHAMVTLLQQSLIEAEQTGENSKIIDNWEDTRIVTLTILDPEELTNSTFVAYVYFDSFVRKANFNSNNRRSRFYSHDPNYGDGFIRARASVLLLEF